MGNAANTHTAAGTPVNSDNSKTSICATGTSDKTRLDKMLQRAATGNGDATRSPALFVTRGNT